MTNRTGYLKFLASRYIRVIHFLPYLGQYFDPRVILGWRYTRVSTVSGFQGRASGHQNLLQYPWIDHCLMVTGPIVVQLTLAKRHPRLVVNPGANVQP